MHAYITARARREKEWIVAMGLTQRRKRRILVADIGRRQHHGLISYFFRERRREELAFQKIVRLRAVIVDEAQRRAITDRRVETGEPVLQQRRRHGLVEPAARVFTEQLREAGAEESKAIAPHTLLADALQHEDVANEGLQRTQVERRALRQMAIGFPMPQGAERLEFFAVEFLGWVAAVRPAGQLGMRVEGGGQAACLPAVQRERLWKGHDFPLACTMLRSS